MIRELALCERCGENTPMSHATDEWRKRHEHADVPYPQHQYDRMVQLLMDHRDAHPRVKDDISSEDLADVLMREGYRMLPTKVQLTEFLVKVLPMLPPPLGVVVAGEWADKLITELERGPE